MELNEQIIISLTTWSARINNIPIVLDSIYSQTVLPDNVVLNLAYDEIIPDNVYEYISNHNVLINRVEDTKVYKKLIPALELFPDALVITIDDDFIYPKCMIEDFIHVHAKHPGFPISGNRVFLNHIKWHCGCASLMKKDYFGKYFDYIDADVIQNCPCDDIVYTYFILRNGKRYRQTTDEYFINMESVNPVHPYSEENNNPIDTTWNYLVNRFGPIKGVNKLIIIGRILQNYFIELFVSAVKKSKL